MARQTTDRNMRGAWRVAHRNMHATLPHQNMRHAHKHRNMHALMPASEHARRHAGHQKIAQRAMLAQPQPRLRSPPHRALFERMFERLGLGLPYLFLGAKLLGDS